MAEDMKEIILMIKKKDKESFIGQTEESMRVAGETENNMVRVHIPLLAVRRSKVNGKKEKDFIG